MIASSIGLSLLAIVAIIIGQLAGANTREGIWLTVLVLPPIGLVLGVLLLIAFMVVSAIRRSRAARDAGK
jgi:hypothetical protein